jgi:glycosyltransferase involved in cell wall biosynthesis
MTQDIPLISVVLPVYNVQDYIEECIASILSQSVQDFEVVVIDDCSTDRTVEIIESFDDQRIQITRKEKNGGLIESLNVGFQLAKGKYIARVDGDDYNHPLRFEKQLNILINNPKVNACGCWMESFGSTKFIIKHRKEHKEIQSRLLISNPMSLGSAMLFKDAFKNFQFNIKKIHVEDYDFWAQAAWSCEFYNIQEVLYFYRFHEEQVSTKYKKLQEKGDIDIKLELFHKLLYDVLKYPDSLLTKILNANIDCDFMEFKSFFKWCEVIMIQNFKLNIFDKTEFEKVISEIRWKIIFKLYFKNTRLGVNSRLRFSVFRLLNSLEKWTVFKLKIKERTKLIKAALKRINN